MFTQQTGLSYELAQEIVHYISNHYPKDGIARLFWSGYAGWVLEIEGDGKQNLMYDREHGWWYWGSNEEMRKIVEDYTFPEGLSEKDKQVLRELQGSGYGNVGISQESYDYIKANYTEIGRDEGGDGEWYKAHLRTADSKYGRFMIDIVGHRWRYLTQLEWYR